MEEPQCSSPVYHHSNGLLLLGTTYGQFILYNPCLREFSVLPKCSIEYCFEGYERAIIDFVPDTNIYKVRLMRIYRMAFKVLTLGTDSSWRVIDNLPYPIDIGYHACVGGVIYFKIFSSPPEYYNMSFNLKDEKFGTIYPPCSPKLFDLFELEGRLCFSDYAGDNMNFQLWIYGQGTNKWTSKYTIDFRLPIKTLIPIAVTGRDLVLQICENYDAFRSCRLTHHDPTRKSFRIAVRRTDLCFCYWRNRKEGILDFKSCFQVISYMESLLSLRKLGIQCSSVSF